MPPTFSDMSVKSRRIQRTTPPSNHPPPSNQKKKKKKEKKKKKNVWEESTFQTIRPLRQRKVVHSVRVKMLRVSVKTIIPSVRAKHQLKEKQSVFFVALECFRCVFVNFCKPLTKLTVAAAFYGIKISKVFRGLLGKKLVNRPSFDRSVGVH